jgi:hypothetical protein
MVGDAWRDIQAGAAAGCRTLAVGDRECWSGRFGVEPEAVLRDLAQATECILSFEANAV